MIKQSKRILGIITLLGVFSLTVLWWSGMHSGTNHNCVAATVQNEVCPNTATPASAVFHVQAWQSLAANVIPLTSLPFLLLLAVALWLVTAARLRYPTLRVALQRVASRAIAPPGERRHWLSLLEHSPPVTTGRV